MLYLAFPTDLRDRFKDSVWLAYAGRIQDTRFEPADTLVTCEWMFPERDALLQTLGRVRQSGARVVFVGAAAHESDTFKRELCLQGIYDFLFVGEELVLQELDALLGHARSAQDVAVYLHREEENVIEPPKLVDVFEGADEPFTWEPLEQDGQAPSGDRFDTLFQPNSIGSSATGEKKQGAVKRLVRRFVWPDPAPVRVRILGERGCGKSFIALQLASLCHANELPAAVVEEEPATLQQWCDASFSSHIYASEPPKGYRVIFDTRADGDMPLSNIDLILVVTWPDDAWMGDKLLPLQTKPGVHDRVICVVNHDTVGLLVDKDHTVQTVAIPHEPRQFHAMRMQTPLVHLDPHFAKAFLPIVRRISTAFVDPARQTLDGGDEHAIATRV
ncbi:hypothetical protein [Ferroacidibacillus organovorans]|uniref:Uncharacterized protein n=1 Tax=Ferroacidibacillus organovorans TaxID=1765683 RepID=A0A117SXS9_9BACL|nr:hypothetical protein [Ferroacidibacillus organovorans]KUO95821.1 hypothetical protein ATW55_15105 [Ferroacidibacillus organovorans]